MCIDSQMLCSVILIDSPQVSNDYDTDDFKDPLDSCIEDCEQGTICSLQYSIIGTLMCIL